MSKYAQRYLKSKVLVYADFIAGETTGKKPVQVGIVLLTIG